MRRYVPLLIAGPAMLAAACSDVTAPVSPVSASNLSAVSVSPAAAKKPPRNAQIYVQEFVIPVAGGVVQVGEFTLTFPANSVCRLGSGYGKNFWDKPCLTVNYDFPVTAKYWYDNGESLMEFAPDVRFSPAVAVIVSTFRQQLVGATSLGTYEIFSWTRGDNGRAKQSDANADPSLQTQFDPASGKVWRRIKHFSGISISSGGTCDPTLVCVATGGSE